MFPLRQISNKITAAFYRTNYLRTMADAVLNGHNADAVESKSDEPEFDFKEYYSREKTLELRDTYIP